MHRTPGVVVGIVKSLEDPDGLGRIKVEFPWLDDEIHTTWASIATPMAGKGRGMFFMPEEKDECLVAFHQGCFDHPFVVGFTWNGADEPPNEDIDFHVRRFQSVTGHILEFNDTEDTPWIRIRTQGGHEVVLDDTGGSERVAVTSNAGHTIELDDASANRVYVEDVTGNSIEMNDSGITLAAASGKDVTIRGTTIVLEATADVNVSGAGLSLDATGDANLSAGSVSLEAQGDVGVSGTQVDISATAKLSASGNPIHLNP